MADLVALSEVEQLVGAERWETEHIGRASSDGRLYILHSRECLRRLGHENLRDCRFTEALEDMNFENHLSKAARSTPVRDVWGVWADCVDVPVLLEVREYGLYEGKGVPWYCLVPAQRLPRIYVPRHESLVRKYRD